VFIWYERAMIRAKTGIRKLVGLIREGGYRSMTSSFIKENTSREISLLVLYNIMK